MSRREATSADDRQNCWVSQPWRPPSPVSFGERRDIEPNRQRRLRLATLLALLIACTSGCTPLGEYITNGFKVGPNYQRPAAPVAQNWIDEDDVRVREDVKLVGAWWTVFNDPILNTLVMRSYQQNLTLREAGYRVLQARALRAIAAGNLFPQQQDAFGAYSRNAFSTAAVNPLAGQIFNIDRFFSQWEGGFSLAWELDFWGRFRRAVEAADAELDASVEAYDDVLVTLVGDVAATYVEMRTLERELALVRGNIELQTQTLAIAEARFRGGQISELDVDQAQSTLAQTQALVPQFEIQLRQANNRLCVLLGIPPEDLAAILGPGRIPVAPPEVAVGIPAELLTRRPDVRRAERRVAAQNARVGVAVSELYPHIGITGTMGVSAEQLNDLFTSRAFNGTIGPGFQWNVLNYGRLLAGIRLQDARLYELIVAYQNTVLQAAAEVENGIVQFLRSQEQTRYLAESVDAAERAVRISIAQYRGGQVDFNRVALLQQNLVEQQDLLAQSQGEIALGLIATYRALGGGWEIRLDPRPIGAAPLGPPGRPGEPVEPRAIDQPDAAPLPMPGPRGPLAEVDPAAASSHASHSPASHPAHATLMTPLTRSPWGPRAAVQTSFLAPPTAALPAPSGRVEPRPLLGRLSPAMPEEPTHVPVTP